MKLTYFIIISLSIILNLSIVYGEMGFFDEDKPHLVAPINYTLLIPTVNNSQYLQGYTPQQVANLFTESDPYYFSNPRNYLNSSTLDLSGYALKNGNDKTLSGVWGDSGEGIILDFTSATGTFNNYLYAYDLEVWNDLTALVGNFENVFSTSDIYVGSAYGGYYGEFGLSFGDMTGISTDGAGGLTIDGGSFSMNMNTFNLGTNENTDVTLSFLGDSHDGVMKWLEDEDRFQFSDSVIMDGTRYLFFSDTGSLIHHDGTRLYISDSAGVMVNDQLLVTGQGTAEGDITIGGTRPDLLFNATRLVGGVSYSIMKAKMTNTDNLSTNVGAVGIFGSANEGVGAPTGNYMWFDARDTGAYNVATLKVDSNDRVGIALSGTTRPSYPLHVLGNTSGITIYSEANISATGYITRTSTFDKSKGNALDLIKDSSELRDINGKIIHSNFYGFVEYDAVDYSRPVVTYGDINGDGKAEEIIDYPYTIKEQGVNIVDEIELLRQAIYELKNENENLKTRFLRLEQETCTIKLFSWCVK